MIGEAALGIMRGARLKFASHPVPWSPRPHRNLSRNLSWRWPEVKAELAKAGTLEYIMDMLRQGLCELMEAG